MDIFSLNLLLNNYGMNLNQMVCTFNQQMGWHESLHPWILMMSH
jgi:hypothetical protein